MASLSPLQSSLLSVKFIEMDVNCISPECFNVQRSHALIPTMHVFIYDTGSCSMCKDEQKTTEFYTKSNRTKIESRGL